jgi:hypothetical protein
VRRAVIGIIASGIVAAPVAYAKASNNLVIVPPADLPALARQTGEAMFLHDTVDGRTLLYIEQRQGSELAILDVTDPGHVKGEGSVKLEASGPFDVVSALGNRAELVRFRQGQADAVLDLHKPDAPTLRTVAGQEADRGIDVKQVGEKITNADTGTTFMLTEGGLYLIRQPAVEMGKKQRDLDVELGNAGAG